MSTTQTIHCPQCGYQWTAYRNPLPTVDMIIEMGTQIVLIQRKNPPHGWALPGGFVDYGEPVEAAALREAKEETGLDCRIIPLLGVYSDPQRDPRHHTISTVYVAQGSGQPTAMDDAADIACFEPDQIPPELAFDHGRIVEDYLAWRRQFSRRDP